MKPLEFESAPLFSVRQLKTLIIPLMVEQLLAMTIGMAATIMVTSVGEAAVSGVSLVDSINVLLIQIFAALATGGAVVASQYLGRGDPETACKAAKQLLWSSTLVAVLIMIPVLLFRRQILILIFGQVEAAVLDSAMMFFRFSALSYPFLAIYNGSAALFRAMGNSKVSMFTSLLMNILNIGGNTLLIYGLNWGVRGAGTAALISRMAGAILLLSLVCRKKNVIHITRIWKPDYEPELIGRILKIGIPNGCENGMFQVGKLMVARLISTFGTAAIAANAIANNLGNIISVPGSAMGLALITVVGQCMGARQPDQAVFYTKRLLVVTYLTMGFFSIAMLLAAGPMVGLFGLSPEATSLAVDIIRLYSIVTLFIWPISFTLPNALRGAGDSKFTMTISMFSMWLFRIGFCFLLCYGFKLQLHGVWIAMYIDWTVRALIFSIRFKRGQWKSIRLI